MKSFNNKVAVITGAGGGIGREFALQLAGKGCDLALADINGKQLIETAEMVAVFGIKASTHIVDVSDEESFQAFVAEVQGHHDSVDLLINNAGITLQRSFENHSLEDWRLVIGVNLWGVINGCKYFLPLLKQSGDAHIINLSSMAGFVGLPNQSSYSATKAAVRSLSESLDAELGVFGIHVTSVHPGAIATNMIRNTLHRSDDKSNAEKNLKAVEKIAMPADKAVEKILKAVQKNKTRVCVGKDAVILDFLKRLMPAGIQILINQAVIKRHARKTLLTHS